MLNIFIKEIILYFSFTGFALAQTWTVQNTGTTARLGSIDFIDSLRGWASGDSGVIIHTTDGGNNWGRQPSTTNHFLASVFFIDSATGWAAGNNGIIVKTTNGGSDWHKQTVPVTTDIGAVFFSNQRMGWAATAVPNPDYLWTTNGGDTWHAIEKDSLTDLIFAVNSIQFIDSLTGYSCGGRRDLTGYVNNTVDGGHKWGVQKSLYFETLCDLHFLNASFGVTVGGDPEYGACGFLTTDAGDSWIQQPVTSLWNYLFSVKLIDSSLGWTCGNGGLIYRINPALQTWEQITPPVIETFYDVDFVNNQTGWFAGQHGTILKYDNNSVGINSNDKVAQNKLFALSNYPNPFNPSTVIRCTVGKPAHAELLVFNILGQPVRKLFSGMLSAGEHRWIWDGTNHHHRTVASGIYIYQLKINNRIAASRKMILLR